MKKTKFLAMLCMVAVACLGFSACSDDDDDNNSGNGGGNATATSLVGRSFVKEYFDVNEDDMPSENTTTLTFTSSTVCSVNNQGYDYIWYNGYRKESYNETKTCNYSVSGDQITLRNYPFFASGGDFVLTYKGNSLTNGSYTFYEK